MEDQRAIVESDTVFDLGDIVDKEKGAHQWYISINTMDQVCGLSKMWIRFRKANQSQWWTRDARHIIILHIAI